MARFGTLSRLKNTHSSFCLPPAEPSQPQQAALSPSNERPAQLSGAATVFWPSSSRLRCGVVFSLVCSSKGNECHVTSCSNTQAAMYVNYQVGKKRFICLLCLWGRFVGCAADRWREETCIECARPISPRDGWMGLRWSVKRSQQQ